MLTSVAGSPFSPPAALDPALLSAVMNSVKVALASEQATVLTPIAGLASSSPMQTSVPGDIPSQDLGTPMETFLASGTGFPSSLLNTLSPSSQGRPNDVVPSFVSTFVALCSALLANSLMSLGSSLLHTMPVGVNTSHSSLLSG